MACWGCLVGWVRELIAGTVCELVASLRLDMITPTCGGGVVRGSEEGFTCSLVSALTLPTNTDVLTLTGGADVLTMTGGADVLTLTGGADTAVKERLVLGVVRERTLAVLVVKGTERGVAFEVGLLMRAVRLDPMPTGGVGVATDGVGVGMGTALSSPSKAAMLRCCTITWTSPAVICAPWVDG